MALFNVKSFAETHVYQNYIQNDSEILRETANNIFGTQVSSNLWKCLKYLEHRYHPICESVSNIWNTCVIILCTSSPFGTYGIYTATGGISQHFGIIPSPRLLLLSHSDVTVIHIVEEWDRQTLNNCAKESRMEYILHV